MPADFRGLPSRYWTSYVARMPTDDDDLDDWADSADLGDDGSADYCDPGDDEELSELTGEIGSIMAGRTVVPAAIAWWRMRRGRRA